MKYLRLFNTEAEYNSATLDLPNVSYIEEGAIIFYTPSEPKLITFTYYNQYTGKDGEYQVNEGTTFGEFLDSIGESRSYGDEGGGSISGINYHYSEVEGGDLNDTHGPEQWYCELFWDYQTYTGEHILDRIIQERDDYYIQET